MSTNRYVKQSRQILELLIKRLTLQRGCLLCLRVIKSQYAICEDCELELPWNTRACISCGLPASAVSCVDCSINAFTFRQVIAPFTFDFPIDTAIARFKHEQAWPIGQLLTQLLARELAYRYDLGLTPPDLLLAMPLSKARLRKRGFNQAQLMAQWLAASLQLPLYAARFIQRTDKTAQQQLSAAQRKMNVAGSFSMSARAPSVQQLHIAVVDDVMTTGASVQELTRVLLAAGAARVDVYCLARTPKARSLASD